MLFGRRKPGYTTTVDGSADPEQAVLELQKAELAAKKKPKAEVFDIDAASETARRLKGQAPIDFPQETARPPRPHPKPPRQRRPRLRSRSCWIFWPLLRKHRATPTRISPPSRPRSCPSLPPHRNWQATSAPALRLRC